MSGPYVHRLKHSVIKLQPLGRALRVEAPLSGAGDPVQLMTSSPPVASSAAPLYSAEPGVPRVARSALAVRGGVSTEHLHVRERTCTAPPKRLRWQRGHRPRLPFLLGDTAAPEERASRPIDQPQRVPRNPAPEPSRGRGPAEDPGSPAVHQGPSCPRCAWPDGEHAPPRRSPCGGDHRVRPALAEAPPKPAEAAIVAGLLASRGRRRVWPPPRQHGGADPGTCPWGPALQERDAPQPPPRAPAARQGRRTASRCAACDRQERRRGRGTARPGPRLNCPRQRRPGPRGTTRSSVPASACRGAQRGAGGQTHSHLRPEPEPDTWPSTSVKP